MLWIVRKPYLESAQKFFSRRKNPSWSGEIFGKKFQKISKKCHFWTLPFFGEKKKSKKFRAAQKNQREVRGSSPISILKAEARAFPDREPIARARGRTRDGSGRQTFFFEKNQKVEKNRKKIVSSAHGVNQLKNDMPLSNSERCGLLRIKTHYGAPHFEQFHAETGAPKRKLSRKKAKNRDQKHAQNRPKNFSTTVSCRKPNEKWWLFFLTSMIRPWQYTAKNFMKNAFAMLSNEFFDTVSGRSGPERPGSLWEKVLGAVVRKWVLFFRCTTTVQWFSLIFFPSTLFVYIAFQNRHSRAPADNFSNRKPDRLFFFWKKMVLFFRLFDNLMGQNVKSASSKYHKNYGISEKNRKNRKFQKIALVT